MTNRVASAVALVALALVAGGGRRAFGVEVWTPQAGEVSLEEPRDTPEARFRHACGLVGAGECQSAIALLRELVEKWPAAEFVERARYTICVALFSSQDYVEAFEEAEGFLKDYPNSESAADARDLQFRAARKVGQHDLEDGLALFEKLVESAPSDAFAAQCRKQKGDLALLQEEYIWAKDEYMALVEYYPRSYWVPYCFYKIAQCDLELGLWLARGDEHIRRARRMLRDFVRVYPQHSLVEQARQKLARARMLEAEQNRRIALFYIECMKRPTAAVSYLRRIINEFSDTEQARWAAETLAGILKSEQTPLRGRLVEVGLPGLIAAKAEED